MRQTCRGWVGRISIVAALVATCVPAGADEQANEDRLRDALRQSVTEMRAAQDQAAQAQADLARANADKAAIQQQLDAANAKLAQAAGKSAARPADAEALQNALRAAQEQEANLAQKNTKLQSSFQGVAELARAKDAESRQAQAVLKAKGTALETCKTANTKLLDVAEQILHLYQSQDFRSVLLRSYEPLVGMEKVKLENMVQDYDDKIRDQEYIAPVQRGR